MTNKQIVGLFSNYADANGAVTDLMENGYSKNDISLIAKQDSLNSGATAPQAATQNDVENDLGEGTVSGARTGAMVGGLAGLIVGISALAIPGIGPLITLGTLSTAIGSTAVGAGVGAAGGGVVGGLLGLGLSNEEAAEYEKSLTEGSILVSVVPIGSVQTVHDIFVKNKAVKVH